MCHLLLAEADAGIAKSKVFAVIFAGRIKVGFSLHIIALALRKQESVLQMPNIGADCICRDGSLLPGAQSIRNLSRICQRAHGGTKQIDYLLQNIGPLNFFPLCNILDINLGK